MPDHRPSGFLGRAPRGIFALARLALLSSALPLAAALAASAHQDGADRSAPDQALELEQDLDGAERDISRGSLRAARRVLEEILEEAPKHVRARCLLAQARFDGGEPQPALELARQALEDALHPAERPSAGQVAVAARCVLEFELDLGRSADAARTLERVSAVLAPAREARDGPARDAGLDDAGLDDGWPARDARDGPARDRDRDHDGWPARDARDGWLVGRTWWIRGERDRAQAVWSAASAGETSADVRRLLARARCERALGWLERASATLVEADRQGRPGSRGDPDVLVELGQVYFEADGEVDDPRARARSPAKLYRAALELASEHEQALLSMFRLHRFNPHRQSRPAEAWLDELLSAHPRSIEGLIASASADLDDGQLPRVRERLEALDQIAPLRREVRSLHAALDWVEHQRERAEALLAELEQENPRDGSPRREMGRHLCELYRFAEARPFLERAVEIDPSDFAAWTELGRARANSGDEAGALAALRAAEEKSAGRQNAWRNNTRLVLERMHTGLVRETSGAGEGLGFRWKADHAALLGLYQKPFYRQAREELAQRYGFTPEPVEVQVFERFQDFSVRSTGFEGFPALGVCFGPVVTAVSPASELRRKFNWARTAFHEFTHVVHLGLSHNRCPRWITEGLATWEETARHPAWTRNMRRELLDALANDELIPVRELNRAFRTSRILFGYYQGGLLCEMWIARHGFAPMVRLLEAFDRGLDLDQALAQVFNTSPEQVDHEFRAYVVELTKDLAIEPRWSPAKLAAARATFARQSASDSASAREAWSSAGHVVALGEWQSGAQIDAEEALRRLKQAGVDTPRLDFLRAQIALKAGRGAEARAAFERAVAAGGRDYSAFLALAAMHQQAGDSAQALAELERAEAAFPGYPDEAYAAELAQAEIHLRAGREDEAWRARERWLSYNSDAFDFRLELARRALHAKDDARAARWFEEANQIDPFLRTLHADWGAALFRLGRYEEALREARAAALVPADLDDPRLGALSDPERAAHLALEARCLLALERGAEALEAYRRALELDAESSELRALESQFSP